MTGRDSSRTLHVGAAVMVALVTWVVAVLATSLAWGVAARAATTAPDAGPSVSAVTQSGRTLGFVFSAGALRPGETLVPSAVHVTVDGTSVPATATIDSASGPAAALPAREAIMVLDVSGSMRGTGIAAAQTAALAYAAGVPADVRIGLVTFSDTPHLLLAATTDRAALRFAIQHVSAGGGTSLYDGVLAATAATNTPDNGQRRLIILSDGEDTSSRYTVADVVAALGRAHIAADVVRFRFGGNSSLDRIAAESGGKVLPATSAADLARAFSDAARAFTAQAQVRVVLPAAMAGKRVALTVSAHVGTRTVTAPSVTVEVPSAASGPAPVTHTAPPAAAKSAVASPASSTGMYLVLGAAFVAILGLALLAIWWPLSVARQRSRTARLAEIDRYRVRVVLDAPPGTSPSAASNPNNVTSAALSVADRAVRARGTRAQIVETLARAGLRLRAEEWVVLQLSAVLVTAALVTVVLRSPVGLPIGGGLGYAGMRAFLSIKISRRAAAFEAQLPDMLQLLAGSVRSGFSLNQAVAGVVAEGAEPVASEFARALTEVRLGADLEDALEQVAERMKSLDLHLVLLAVRTSREVGGNLAEVLLTTAATMRERGYLKGQVKVLSAEGRMSARVLIALPFLMIGYLLAFRPNYLHPLVSTGMGWALVVTGSVLLATGAVWVTRMVRIEV